MKRILFLFLLLSSFAVTVVAADELKDNRLQIDNSRIEKEQELNFGAQSEGTKSLFVAENQEKIQEMKQYQNKQLATEAGQLFSAIQRPVKKSSEEQLFQPNAQKTIKFQTNIGHVEKGGLNDFLPEIFYVVLIFLLFGATAVMSYRVMVEGMD